MHLILLVSDPLRLERVVDGKRVDTLGDLLRRVGQVAVLLDGETGLGAGEATVVEVYFGGLFLYGEGQEVAECCKWIGLRVED